MAKTIDRDELLDHADIQILLDHYHLRQKYAGSTLWIECPNPAHHSEHAPDNHLTNCHVSRNRKGQYTFKCESGSCKEGGTMIDLVRLQEGVGIREAMYILSDIVGGSEDAFTRDCTEAERKQIVKKKKLISEDDLQLLGLSVVRGHILRDDGHEEFIYDGPRDYAVYGMICPVPWTNREGNDHWKELAEKGLCYINGMPPAVYRKLSDNALLDLMETDEEAYRFLIGNKAKEKLDYFRSLRKNPGKDILRGKTREEMEAILQNTPDSELRKTLMVHFDNELRGSVGDHFQNVVETAVKRLEDICIEFGTYQPESAFNLL